jgi:tripartite-type tricarboxylate transporter receptor subunit TctC
MLVKVIALCAMVTISTTDLMAQNAWPAGKTITLVVGYPAGGSTDLVARTVGEALGKRLNTQVIVENVAGAGGTIGAQKVVNATPDGTTLLLGSGSEVSIARIYNAAVKYDGEKDLLPIGLVGTTPMVFVANSKMKVKTMDDVIVLSKREPNTATFASSGIGTPLHIAGELINLRAGTTLRHVPYRGAAQMVQDVLGNNVDYGVFVLSSALPHIRSGKMQALGLTTAARSRAAPDIAPLGDTAKLKGYDLNVWFGLLAPAKLAPALQTKLNTELVAVLKQPEVWKKLQDAGIATEPGTPKALSDFIRAETVKARSVVAQAITGN